MKALNDNRRALSNSRLIYIFTFRYCSLTFMQHSNQLSNTHLEQLSQHYETLSRNILKHHKQYSKSQLLNNQNNSHFYNILCHSPLIPIMIAITIINSFISHNPVQEHDATCKQNRNILYKSLSATLNCYSNTKTRT